MAVVDPIRLSNMVDWLEDENRQLKEQVIHQGEALDQALKLLREQSLRIEALEQELAVLRPPLAKVASLEDAVFRERESLSQFTHEQSAVRQLAERVDRERKADSERYHVAIVELWQRVDYLQQELEQVPARFQALADTGKRLHDGLFVAAKQIEQLEQQLNNLDARVSFIVEQAKRLEHELATWETALAPLHRADEALLTRLQVVGDAVKAQGEQLATAFLELERWQEVSDRLESMRVEVQRASRELVTVQQVIEEHNEQFQALQKHLLQADSRRESLATRLAELEQAQQAAVGELEHQLSELRAILERQARRLSGEFETQAKELRDRTRPPEKR
jgi:chromosome segregation ATPase